MNKGKHSLGVVPVPTGGIMGGEYPREGGLRHASTTATRNRWRPSARATWLAELGSSLLPTEGIPAFVVYLGVVLSVSGLVGATAL